MEAIVQQLKDYCGCLPDNLEDTALEKAVKELIHLVSIMTCWTDDLCGTFLNGMRKEIFDAERINLCSCESGIFEFIPFYVPIYPETISAVLVEQDGLTDKVTEIDPTDIVYSETFEKIRINYQKYFTQDDCKCPQDAKIVVQYVAGYEELPECILPILCDLLQIVLDKLKCDCGSCQQCEKGEGVVIDFNDEVSPDLEDYLKELLIKNYQKQLGLISLCGRIHRIWGVLV
ncbi:hypothetical protein NRIC_03900 [Enterococcus florum]|uniref:Uncharacterized protein n=1 Tax=Enterococcus florum TaxID=2480627 RepID=A0A4V0WP37_9ENTE|nr:hypothetical protein [Enterococcus florum]GCF92499.1 hypothetical protein NRIC_03900 [Enterococcus florum]